METSYLDTAVVQVQNLCTDLETLEVEAVVFVCDLKNHHMVPTIYGTTLSSQFTRESTAQKEFLTEFLRFCEGIRSRKKQNELISASEVKVEAEDMTLDMSVEEATNEGETTWQQEQTASEPFEIMSRSFPQIQFCENAVDGEDGLSAGARAHRRRRNKLKADPIAWKIFKQKEAERHRKRREKKIANKGPRPTQRGDKNLWEKKFNQFVQMVDRDKEKKDNDNSGKKSQQVDTTHTKNLADSETTLVSSDNVTVKSEVTSEDSELYGKLPGYSENSSVDQNLTAEIKTEPKDPDDISVVSNEYMDCHNTVLEKSNTGNSLMSPSVSVSMAANQQGVERENCADVTARYTVNTSGILRPTSGPTVPAVNVATVSPPGATNSQNLVFIVPLGTSIPSQNFVVPAETSSPIPASSGPSVPALISLIPQNRVPMPSGQVTLLNNTANTLYAHSPTTVVPVGMNSQSLVINSHVATPNACVAPLSNQQTVTQPQQKLGSVTTGAAKISIKVQNPSVTSQIQESDETTSGVASNKIIRVKNKSGAVQKLGIDKGTGASEFQKCGREVSQMPTNVDTCSEIMVPNPEIDTSGATESGGILRRLRRGKTRSATQTQGSGASDVKVVETNVSEGEVPNKVEKIVPRTSKRIHAKKLTSSDSTATETEKGRNSTSRKRKAKQVAKVNLPVSKRKKLTSAADDDSDCDDDDDDDDSDYEDDSEEEEEEEEEEEDSLDGSKLGIPTDGTIYLSSDSEIMNDNECKMFIESYRNINTMRKTKGHINLVQKFIDMVDNERRKLHTIPPYELNMILTRFFCNLTQENGSFYEPSTLRGIMGSIERHLGRHRYGVSVINGVEFSQTREAMRSKQIESKTHGLGKKSQAASAITEEDIDLLYEKGLLGCSTPSSILNTLWFNNTVYFQIRGSSRDHKILCWGDFRLCYDSSVDKEYLEYDIQKMKDRIGIIYGTSAYKNIKVYAMPDVSRCPVYTYKVYSQMRPKDFCRDQDPFYLSPTHPAMRRDSSNYKEKFTRAHVGRNKLVSLMKQMAFQAQLPDLTNRNISNTSLQKFVQQKGLHLGPKP